MRKITFQFILTILALISAMPFLHGQIYSINRGERPPVDLSVLSPEAWEPGVIKIKFTENAERSHGSIIAQNDANGFLTFGIPTVDELNRQFGIQAHLQTFASAAFSGQRSERHRAWGFHLWYTLYPGENADIPTLVSAYQALAEVEIAEPEYRKRLIGNAPPTSGILPLDFNPAEPLSRWTPDDPQLEQQWHYNNTGQQNGTPGADIGLFAAWELEKGSADVVVAIIDDGIQFNHSDLEANMWEGIGYNFANNTVNINPGNHGTHVAGTVAAVSNNSVGVAGVAGGTGAGDGVRLMSAQVFSGGSQGGFHLAPVWAADNGAAISQNSWGYTTPNVYDQNVLDAIDYFNVNGGGEALIGGGITIFAAGNDNGNGAYYPGYYSGAFAVAATNNQDVKSWYSNYGDWIDISAPGGETNTVNARGVLSTLTGNNYGFYQGTSMACPHVSGVAALMVSLAYGELTPDEVAEILVSTVDDHYENNPGFIGQLGSGRMNALNALLETLSYINGVRNPSSFTALALDQSEISLNWKRNADTNDILIAWAALPVFGSPEAGLHYFPGDSIPGGGLVLYAGSDTSFLHQELESSTMHYYRAWSVNDTMAYSVGRSASARTACEWYVIPFAEGFEEQLQLPPCWTQETVSGGISWAIGSGNSGSNPPNAFEGNLNAYYRSSGIFENSLTTRLITPQLNFSQVDTAVLNFHYTNALRIFFIWGFQDILRVKYKNAADADWETLQEFGSDVPQWAEVNIPLPNLSSDYYIAFEGVSNSGFGIALDAININDEEVAGFFISAVAGPNGSIQPNGNVFVPEGNTQAFEVQADTGYYIAAIVVDTVVVDEAVGLVSYTYVFDTVFSNHSIAATFSPNAYQLELVALPEGSGSLDFEGELFHNEQLTVFAEAADGYEFSHWALQGDTMSTDNPFTFVLTSDLTLEGHFKMITMLHEYNLERVKIIPNPNRGHFSVELAKPSTIQLFAANGLLLYESEKNPGLNKLNLSPLKAGVYLLRIVDGDGIMVKKLIVY